MQQPQPAEQALFPLNTPLFPKCIIQLQIFEPRYLNMISACLRSGASFTVCLLREGFEKLEVLGNAESPAQPVPICYSLGTSARIIDFGQMPNGLLSISLQGEQRQRLRRIRQQADGLWLGQTDDLAEINACQGEIPPIWTAVLKSLGNSGILAHAEAELLSDPELAMNYIAMYAPLPAFLKQSLLELDDLQIRWRRLRDFTAQNLTQV
ncbi:MULTISPECIES: LON peptidase substrate-binding domain-containing protein [Methylomonas]|uniref:LON peptidase substrate-binding domain-containing protein n=1 Tax=Methylomonas TaxID=416 RepID=UPI001232E1F5|nr:LON peptidase substrate-binding domain-containing protein [Methylomonas rhizoryzae]